jgi:hypothetical protein
MASGSSPPPLYLLIFPSSSSNKKKSSHNDDTEPIAFPRKPKISRTSHSNSPSQLEMAAVSLIALKNSATPMEPITTPLYSPLLPLQPGITTQPLAFSHISSNSGFLDRQVNRSPPPLQTVTTTLALMADPPILSRRFFRSTSGRKLFNPAIMNDASLEVTTSSSTTSTEVSQAGPPPPPSPRSSNLGTVKG